MPSRIWNLRNWNLSLKRVEFGIYLKILEFKIRTFSATKIRILL